MELENQNKWKTLLSYRLIHWQVKVSWKSSVYLQRVIIWVWVISFSHLPKYSSQKVNKWLRKHPCSSHIITTWAPKPKGHHSMVFILWWCHCNMGVFWVTCSVFDWNAWANDWNWWLKLRYWLVVWGSSWKSPETWEEHCELPVLSFNLMDI